MLTSCSYCSGLHNRGETCSKRPKLNSGKKEQTYITKFRSSSLWRKKRNEIKIRDKYLCQICLQDQKYIFNKLDVHHIRPIIDSWNNRLNSLNLITLCRPCHYLADNNEIEKSLLLEIAAKNEKKCKRFILHFKRPLHIVAILVFRAKCKRFFRQILIKEYAN